MKCENCGNEMNPGTAFCGHCDARADAHEKAEPEQRRKRGTGSAALWAGIGAAVLVAAAAVLVLLLVVRPGSGGSGDILEEKDLSGIAAAQEDEGFAQYGMPYIRIDKKEMDLVMSRQVPKVHHKEYAAIYADNSVAAIDTLIWKDYMTEPVSISVSAVDVRGVAIETETLKDMMIMKSYLQGVDDYSKYQDAQTLIVIDEYDTADYSEIAKLGNVKWLYLFNCIGHENLNALEGMNNLEGIYISGGDIRSIDGLAKLENLKSLSLYFLYDLENIEELKQMPQLEWLSCAGLPNVRNLESMANLQNLKSLRIGLQSAEIDGLSKLTGLRELSIMAMNEIEDLKELAGLRNLEALELLGMESLDDISALSGLRQLEELMINDAQDLSNIDVLQTLENLKYLGITDAPKIDNLDALAGLESLKALDIEYLGEVNDLDMLRSITGLGWLLTAGLYDVPSLEAMEALDSLETLAMYNMDVDNIEVLLEMPSLRTLTCYYIIVDDKNAGMGIIKKLRESGVFIDKYLRLEGA